MVDGQKAVQRDRSAPRDWGKWRDYRSTQFGMLSDAELEACETCGCPTDKTGTRRCDGCWEVEHRIAGYLRDGGLAAHDTLMSAMSRAHGYIPPCTACLIEAEIGTEENPHPVPERFHVACRSRAT
jgi:hypothetical protein